MQSQNLKTGREKEKVPIPHEERTKGEKVHRVALYDIQGFNNEVKVLRLRPLGEGLMFLPGQWLDVHIPTLPKAGGFTITSSPSILTSKDPYIELAIQRSPSNPAAAWLWQSPTSILNLELQVRVGGSFTWSPRQNTLKRAVFVAGGVGINPLISMLSQIIADGKEKWDGEVRFLYSVRDPGIDGLGKVLFLERLRKCIQALGEKGSLKLFLTSPKGKKTLVQEEIDVQRGRMTKDNLVQALGSVEERKNTVMYICGVPGMVDEFVDVAGSLEGMRCENVMFEKWW
ncbi:hypothetical protein G7Y89_g11901 [Cudoniella acicularis]|uniref:Oxidoreductase NAD-binding domain-containing protein 1 n=1 Tax=Cudoniella acicularis TaxID=354080 RepID=A0A8H4RA10_9HELO|nr:hypothetical protein G7Y89_g11901 [Cudoniella acicularis]